MAYVPNGSSPHLVKALNNTPVGTLADFSLDSTAIPFDPREGGAQIPTLSATLTDLAVPVKTLIDDDLSFRDWSGADTTAKVKSVKGAANSGLTAIDTSTLFDRLNTEQTTFPIIMDDGATGGGGAVIPALSHWCLMAGVPMYRTPGNLLQALDSKLESSIGYLADNPAALRFYGPPDTRYGYVPTIGTYMPSLEVNGTQSIIVGAMFGSQTQLAEFRILAWLNPAQSTVIYTVRKVDNTYSVVEKVGSGAETVLLNAVHTSKSNFLHNVNLRISANAADPTKVDLTLRVLEWGQASASGSATEDTYTDYTATAKTSTITQRPLPSKIELGYDSTLLGTRTSYGDVANYFLSEGSVLPEKFPVTQVDATFSTAADAVANAPTKVPGFTANVWEKVKEFCAITEVDVFFDKEAIRFRSRYEQIVDNSTGNTAVPPQRLNKSDMSYGLDNRETSKYVDVSYYTMVGDSNTFTSTELWRADSVYSLNKGEYKEEIVQTDSTFTVLMQPAVVNGVPVPYTWGYSSYVVTGNDGYIVDPQWWQDNGGSIRVEATGTAGEIKIMMQAPNIDTARAPYRISEGVADRPALYIKGTGLNLGKPKTLRIATGAGDAAEEATTFDSSFVTNLQLAYNTGYKVADAQGGAGGTISFGVNKGTLGVADPYGTEYSAVIPGTFVYNGGAMHRISKLSMQPSGLSISEAPQFTSVIATNEGLGADATVDDWNNLHLNKTIKEVNLSPLPQYVS